jgi:hypothetical protein
MSYEMSLVTSTSTKWETAQIRIQKDLKDQVHEYCRRKGMTFSFFVRAVAARALEKDKVMVDRRQFSDIDTSVDDIVAFLPVISKTPFLKKNI